MWPFVETVLAKQSSRNRPAGTPELAGVKVTKEVYKRFIIDKVIPAVYEKWPERPPFQLIMQHDNSPSHLIVSDPDVFSSML